MRERSARTGCVVTGLAVFLCGLDHLVLLTALPAIRSDLGLGVGTLGWLVNAYIVPVAVLPPLAAALGGRVGHRRLFTVALVVFTAGSVLAACSSSVAVLISARAVQGVGAAAIAPLGLTLLNAVLPPDRRSLVLGLWGALGGLAVAVGPLVGGAVVESGGWRTVFWINVPLGCLLAAAAPRLLREVRGDDRTEFAVSRGPLLFGAAALAAVWALPRLAGGVKAAAAVLDPVALAGAGLLGVGLASAWLGRVRGSTQRHGDRGSGADLAAVHVCGFLMHAAVFGTVFWLAQFPQSVQGHGPWEAGLRILPWTVMPLLVAPVAGLVMGRTGARAVAIAGFGLTAASSAWFALVLEPGAGYGVQVPGLVAGGVGMALFFTAAPQLLLERATNVGLASASGVNTSVREAGAVAGVAAAAALFTRFGSATGPQAFTDGLAAVLWGAVAVATLGFATAAAMRRPCRAAATCGPAFGRINVPAQV
ncbi:MFS transporter [Streptomyces sp. H27-S2]|uniref:MFS transporter n=1 Tax=Streptomyces antarcticus TaxID=2996458 RepID=UPI002270CD64|nr:MFS transporter [Streptomyces sp. H27-S2]MCY0954784.1 MFS transporter [Streptomyces sp. H27-S2]